MGHPEKSPFVEVTSGAKFRIRFDRDFPYELDGGARPAARKLRIKAKPSSVTICVPPAADGSRVASAPRIGEPLRC
jgi:diacylglycerol kinase family enzyme